MRLAILALPLLFCTGCVAWQSSFDELHSDFRNFKVEIAQSYQASESALEKIKASASDETRALLEAAEADRKQRDLLALKDLERDAEEAARKNEEKTKAVVSAAIDTSVDGLLKQLGLSGGLIGAAYTMARNRGWLGSSSKENKA